MRHALSLIATCLLLLSHASLAAAQSPSTTPLLAVERLASPGADAIAVPQDSQAQALRALPEIIQDVMRRSGIPGMAVAVVIGGETVFARGFGYRELGKGEPVDEQTIFQLASLSKSISATVVALEVSRRKVDWHDPVVRYLPNFRLSDPYITEHATIGDFFSHRSGLPGTAGDDLEELGFKRAAVFDRLSALPLEPFRITYNYANFGTTIGAEAVAAAVGQPWETLAESQLFQPLGMTSTSYLYSDFIKRQNRAALHAYKDQKFTPLGQRNADQQAPAGGVSSNVVDLAQWLKLLIASGEFEGKPMISPEALVPALSPQVVSSPPHDLVSRPGFYGYGFNVNTELGGRPSMGHSGAFLLGAGTAFKIVPSAGIGIVVLTNAGPVGAAEAVVATFIDTALYGSSSRDWFAAYNGAMQAFFEPQADLSNANKPKAPAITAATSTAPTINMERYLGRFENRYFGTADIVAEKGELSLILGPERMQFPLQPWEGDTFAFVPAGEAELAGSLASLRFTLQGGKVQHFDIPFYEASGLGRWVKLP